MLSTITFRQPGEMEFAAVKNYVEKFWLDNENMLREQFHVLLNDDKLAAFGRLRDNPDATELCTLGVLEEYRGKKLGADMVKGLLSVARCDIYVVCVIPGFFRKLGFIPVQDFPPSIQKKRDLCTSHYHVGIPYEVMKWGKV